MVGVFSLYAGYYLPHYLHNGESEVFIVSLYIVTRYFSFFLIIAPAVFLKKPYFTIVAVATLSYAGFSSGDALANVYKAQEQYMSFPDEYFTKEMMKKAI